MITENKQDLSVSMLYANVVAVLIMIPVAILQLSLFYMLHGTKNMQFNLYPK
jgi:hypothetical protein